jgi:MFS family permease
VSFVCLSTTRTHEGKVRRRNDASGRPKSLPAEIAEGLRFVWREPRIRSVAGATATSNFFATIGLAVLLVFMRRQLHLAPGRIGILLALGSVGGIFGAVVATRLAARLGVGRTILLTIAVAGIGELCYPLATGSTATALIIGGGLLISVGGVTYNIIQVSLRQALCPPSLQGRMNASVRFMVWGTMPIGGLVGAALGSTIGLRPTLWVAGIGAMTAFLWILLSPVPAVMTMPASPIGHSDRTRKDV